MAKKFIKNIENFICESCGKQNHGNGYTNHCIYCLTSKHVDINPGDRKATCHGLMKPIDIKKQRDHFIITFVCQKCGHIHKNKTNPKDDINRIIQITSIK